MAILLVHLDNYPHEEERQFPPLWSKTQGSWNGNTCRIQRDGQKMAGFRVTSGRQDPKTSYVRNNRYSFSNYLTDTSDQTVPMR